MSFQSFMSFLNPTTNSVRLTRAANEGLNAIPGIGHPLAQVTTAPLLKASKEGNQMLDDASGEGGYMAHRVPGIGNQLGAVADFGTHAGGYNTFQQDKQQKVDAYNNDPSNFISGASIETASPNPALAQGPYQFNPMSLNAFDPANAQMQAGQQYQGLRPFSWNPQG